MSRTVLLISYHYLPAATPGSRRLNTLARFLTRRGWQCIVLTATGARAGEEQTPGVEVIRTTRRELPADGAHPAIARPLVSRLPVLGRLASFPDRYAAWTPVLTIELIRILRDRPISVVMSSSPPHSLHLAVSAARSVRRFPWVAEFRDPWMFPSRREPGAFSSAVQRRMERRVLRMADVVIANTPGNRNALLAENPGFDATRVRVSTNGYESALFMPDSFTARTDETADITYVGEIYPGMLDLYLDALVSIRSRQPASVPRLAVYGTLHSSDHQRISALGLDAYIDDRGFVTHEQSVDAMKRARALLVLLPMEQRWRTCVPSKVYWYLAARRPIFAVVPSGDTSRLLGELGVGDAFVGTDADALGHQLEAFVLAARSRPPALRAAEGIARYSMETITEDIDAILTEVTRGNSS